MKRLSAASFLYLAVVFTAGIAIGALGFRFYEIRSVSAVGPGPRSPEAWKRRHLEELRTRLHLTPEQTSKVESVLDQTRSQYDALMQKNRPEFEQIQRFQFDQVRALLSPDQQAEYDRYHQERELRHRRDHPPRGM